MSGQHANNVRLEYKYTKPNVPIMTPSTWLGTCNAAKYEQYGDVFWWKQRITSQLNAEVDLKISSDRVNAQIESVPKHLDATPKWPWLPCSSKPTLSPSGYGAPTLIQLMNRDSQNVSTPRGHTQLVILTKKSMVFKWGTVAHLNSQKGNMYALNQLKSVAIRAM